MAVPLLSTTDASEAPPCAAEPVAQATPPSATYVPPAEAPLAVREVLGFPARLLFELPLATTLLCSCGDGDAHGGGRLVVTASGASSLAQAAVQAPAFVGREWFALTLAAERERASSAVLAEWCARKVAEPAWRLTVGEALGGLAGVAKELHWSVGQVLRAFGVRLDDVLVTEEARP
jgi:hypothetical protein